MRRAAPLVLLFLAAGRAAPADDLAAQRDEALAKAFKYLDEKLWTLQDGGSPRRQYSLAVAGWAYLLAADKGGKRLPARKQQIDRIRDELLRYAERVAELYEKDDRKRRKDPVPGMPPGFEAMRTAQYVWPLSVSAHFFAEASARGKGTRDAKEALKAIAAALEAAQQGDGGWGHDDASRPGMGLPPIQIPKPGGGQLQYPGTLLAASNCALAGLGTAHAALKSKRNDALAKGREYFAKAQNKDGSFPYDPSQRHETDGVSGLSGTEIARTAGAVYALYCAGAPKDDPVAKRGLELVDAEPGLMSEGHGSATLALQYGALLAKARGPRAWAGFRETFLPRILARQEESGAFLCACREDAPGVTCDTKPIPGLPMAEEYAEGNKVYVTAIHVLILLLDRAEPKAGPEAPDSPGPVTQDR